MGGRPKLLVDKEPAPLIEPQAPIATVYVGNFTGAGAQKQDVQDLSDKFCAKCDEKRPLASKITLDLTIVSYVTS